MLRRATLEDADALSALASTCFTQTFGHLYAPADLDRFIHEAYSPKVLRSELADPQRPTWLFFQEPSLDADSAPSPTRVDEASDGTLIGYVTVCPAHLPHPEVKEGDGEVQRLYLLREYQGGGRGSRMLEHALNWLEADGPRTLWIGAWSENYGAQRLYGRYGFTKVGEYSFMVGDPADREFILRRDAAVQEF